VWNAEGRVQRGGSGRGAEGVTRRGEDVGGIDLAAYEGGEEVFVRQGVDGFEEGGVGSGWAEVGCGRGDVGCRMWDVGR